jgi:hypothetical protein
VQLLPTRIIDDLLLRIQAAQIYRGLPPASAGWGAKSRRRCIALSASLGANRHGIKVTPVTSVKAPVICDRNVPMVFLWMSETTEAFRTHERSAQSL